MGVRLPLCIAVLHDANVLPAVTRQALPCIKRLVHGHCFVTLALQRLPRHMCKHCMCCSHLVDDSSDSTSAKVARLGVPSGMASKHATSVA